MMVVILTNVRNLLPFSPTFPRISFNAPLVMNRIDDRQENSSSIHGIPQALSYLLIASIILTLSGMCLIFFSNDIHDVLWESISLIILGVSATVVSVLPGSGEFRFILPMTMVLQLGVCVS